MSGVRKVVMDDHAQFLNGRVTIGCDFTSLVVEWQRSITLVVLQAVPAARRFRV
jgi:hypothetical protein